MEEELFGVPYPVETEQHRQLRDTIWGELKQWRTFIVAVDGIDAAGKTTLARYLSWQLGMPAVETDMYIVEDSFQNTGTIGYQSDELRRVIENRLNANRPLIVEGIRVLHTLQSLDFKPDFLVWVEQEGWSGGRVLSELLSEYLNVFKASERAHFTFRRPPDAFA
jgi:broad-specificity NMP kinase